MKMSQFPGKQYRLSRKTGSSRKTVSFLRENEFVFPENRVIFPGKWVRFPENSIIFPGKLVGFP